MRKKNFRRKPKRGFQGLQIDVYNNNIEEALKRFKRKVKDSNLFLYLKEKEYYTKPSEIKRHKRNLAKLRTKYAIEKEKSENNH